MSGPASAHAVALRRPPPLEWLSGGKTADLIKDFDWAKTPIGPIAKWPRSLKTIVATLLRSPVPMVLLWGESGVMIYNDAYSVFAGGRHPQLLGSNVREGWPEVADFNDNVMKVGLGGGTLSYRDKELTLYRNGAPEQVWMNLDYSPVLDDDDRPAGVLAIVVETTQRVQAEQALAISEAQRQLLFRELNHRMKNLFAVASGLVGLSARSATSVQDMAHSLQGRFTALARAKELVYARAEAPATATLEALVATVLQPYLEKPGAENRQPIVFGGPPVLVSGDGAASLALVLHESVTNAIKYGALRAPEGSIRIDWTIQDKKLVFHWWEKGGAGIAHPPEANGFGTFLARQSVSGQLGGEIEYEWRPEGLAMGIVIPLDRLCA